MHTEHEAAPQNGVQKILSRCNCKTCSRILPNMSLAGLEKGSSCPSINATGPEMFPFPSTHGLSVFSEAKYFWI